MHSNFEIGPNQGRIETENFYVHVFVRSNQWSQSSQIFWHQNCCALCIHAFKLWDRAQSRNNCDWKFLRSCVFAFKPVKSELSNFLTSKLLCARVFMRSNFEKGLNPDRILTENFCVHAFKPVKSELWNILPSKFLCVHAFMRSKFEIWLSPNRIETKNACVHAFVRSNQWNQSSQIFCHQNCCAFVRSCVQSLRYSSVQIELRPKMSGFMRSCNHPLPNILYENEHKFC